MGVTGSSPVTRTQRNRRKATDLRRSAFLDESERLSKRRASRHPSQQLSNRHSPGLFSTRSHWVYKVFPSFDFECGEFFPGFQRRGLIMFYREAVPTIGTRDCSDQRCTVSTCLSLKTLAEWRIFRILSWSFANLPKRKMRPKTK